MATNPNTVFTSNIVSTEKYEIEAIREEIKFLNLSIAAEVIDKSSWNIIACNCPEPAPSVGLQLRTVDQELWERFLQYDDVSLEPAVIRIGQPCYVISAQTRIHPAIALLERGVIRAIARLTHGILVDDAEQSVDDDWKTWSFDDHPCDITVSPDVDDVGAEQAIKDYPGLKLS